MRICGLITEYNPFHNGHVHHISEAKRLTGCDYLVVAMSGDYVQRGTPAIIDKYERTRMALHSGADLVLELPALFATSSAEIFATAAVSLLNQLGAVTDLCFGSECGDLETLKKISGVLLSEPRTFRTDLKDALKGGMNYPAARALALENHFKGEIENLEEILEKPNNILAIEYLRALRTLHSSMKPVTIKRWHTDYHSEAVYEDVASATALRSMLYEEGGIERITPFVPAYVAREFALKLNVCTPIRSDDLSAVLQYRLFTEKERLYDYLDFTPELSERVKNILPECYRFQEWAVMLKTKVYTHTRINRALLHVVLNFKKSDLEAYEEDDYCLYARILGFRKESTPLLTEIRNATALPMITKMADAKKILPENAYGLLLHDIQSADIFRNAVYQKFGTSLKDEFTAGIIKI